MSGEDKWGAVSDLVLLLPHGFEGQVQSTAPLAWKGFCRVVQKTMWSSLTCLPLHSIFMLFEGKIKEYAKPLIVMAPKSLLRHKLCISEIKEFTHGSFEEFIPDPTPPKNPNTLVLVLRKSLL